MVSATDTNASRVLRELAKGEVLAIEPATVVAFAGTKKLIGEGVFQTDDLVGNSVEQTFPVEKQCLAINGVSILILPPRTLVDQVVEVFEPNAI